MNPMDFLNDEKLSNEEKLRRYFLESGKLPFADREAAQKAAEEQKSGMGIGAALAGAGAAIAGRAPSDALGYFDKRKEAIDAATVGAFDKANKEQSDRVAEYLKNKYAMDLRQQERQDLKDERAQARQEARADRNLNREVMMQERVNKAQEKIDALQTPFGLANTPDDAKQLKEAFESKRNFDNKINQMIALREKHGGGATLNREDVARGKQLSKDLLLEYKNMAKLGVLSKSDEDIINAIIPEDPLAYSFTPGQDPIMSKLKSFKSDSDADFLNRVATRTREGIKGAAAQPQQVLNKPKLVTLKHKSGAIKEVTPEKAQEYLNSPNGKDFQIVK